MTGQPPALDNRQAAAIVARLADLAATSLPGWRPPPDGDAGTMLQQGFARMVELLLSQLNQVPEKNLLAFLDTMGVSLLPPTPARVPLTFALAPGSPATLVGAGTTAAGQSDDGQATVTFTTDTDLTVLPVNLVAARTVDPVADRYTNLTAVVGGTPANPGFSPFTGALRVRRALWFGTSLLPQAGQSAEVTLTIGYTSSRPAAEITSFFGAMRFEYRSAGTAVTATPSQAVQSGIGTAILTLTTATVDEQEVSAPGLAGPIAGQWLRTELATPLAFDPVARDLVITTAAIAVTRSGLLPDAVIAGQATADPSKDFQPFGPTPEIGDACCIGSDEAFGKTGAQVQLGFTASTGTASGLTLAWDYLGASGWQALTVTASTGFNLTSAGTVTIAQLPEIPQTSLGGQVSRWIRVRITAGGYGTPVQWTVSGTTLTPKAGTGDLDPPRLKSVAISYTARAAPVVLRQTDATFSDQREAVAASRPFPAYLPLAAITPSYLADLDPACYLGLDSVVPGGPMSCYVAPVPRAASGRVDPQPRANAVTSADPGPLTWEYFDGSGWRPLSVLDGTAGLTAPGTIIVLTPDDIAPLARFDQDARYWIRARAPRTSPSDERLLTGVYLNTVQAVQAVAVTGEPLGSSTGQAGQIFAVAQPPVLAGQEIWVTEPERPSASEQPDAVVETTDPVTGQSEAAVRWSEVANFVCSGPADRHYTIDHTTGTVTFGDGIRGLIPPAGQDNISASYQTGGGFDGNVAAGAIAQLLSPIPAVQAVTNPLPADGGAPGETVGLVRDRGPQSIRNRDRAVCAGDFEWLARQAAGTRVARAMCLPNINDSLSFEPGWVTLIIVPSSPGARPSPGAELISVVGDYLRARACAELVLPIPPRINVIGPGYVRVAVVARIVPHDLTQAITVRQRVAAALNRYLHPLTGGLAGTGWVSGRPVYVSEIASVIEGTQGVSYATSIRLVPSAVQRRLTLPGVPVTNPVPAGALVRTPDGRKAFLLSELIPAATVTDELTVTGLREGDTVTNLLDLTLTEAPAPASAQLTATPAPWPAPAGYPAGTVVVGPDGRQTRLAEDLPVPAGPGPAPLDRQTLPLVITDPGFAGGLTAGSVITLVGQFPVMITALTARSAEDGSALIDVSTGPVTGDTTYPTGAVFGTLDGRIRLPLASAVAPDPGLATISAATFADLGSAEQIQVLGPSGDQVLTATVTAIAPVDDVVYTDPDVFPYATEHQLDMTGP